MRQQLGIESCIPYNFNYGFYAIGIILGYKIFRGNKNYLPIDLHCKMKQNTHNKHFIFHERVATRVYDVCFDIFRYLSRRPRY